MSVMVPFTVDVAFSNHDDLQRGHICVGVSRVTVLADDDSDAQLIACQMVACRGVMPVASMICV